MNYNEALEYIHATYKFGWKLGLHNINILLELLGNPHKKLKFVHVAGTNGKGSTTAFISRILIEAGYNVGIFTSPYLERFTERIKINHLEISEDELAAITEFVKEKVDIMLERGERHPTEFEIITAIGFQYFWQKKCDVVVLEVGLGGRFDSTNVIDVPLLSVITTINYDHTDRLGNTLEEIAFEKAGIIKQGGDVLLYPQKKEVLEVFQDVCAKRDAKLQIVDFDSLVLSSFSVEGQVFQYGEFKCLEISLLGEHQVKNAATALNAALMLRKKGFDISDTAIINGLKNTKWPGRLEVMRKDPVFLIDGAHNPEGAEVLKETLTKYFSDKRKMFIVGVLQDKNYKSIIDIIMPLADEVITVAPLSERALPAEELAKNIQPYCKHVTVSDKIEEAVGTSLKIASANDIICSFGSLYYIGEIRRIFNCS